VGSKRLALFPDAVACFALRPCASGGVMTGNLSSDTGGISGQGPWATGSAPSTITWSAEDVFAGAARDGRASHHARFCSNQFGDVWEMSANMG
jgi:hypothetical protein